jgi:hypothetical protein
MVKVSSFKIVENRRLRLLPLALTTSYLAAFLNLLLLSLAVALLQVKPSSAAILTESTPDVERSAVIFSFV